MGISGLLPLLRSIIRTVHLASYAGKSVAVDAYSWLHKGIYGSALDLVQGRPNRKYIEYCLTRAKLLVGLGVRPILVFDGAALPMKAGKEAERKAARDKSTALVLRALAKGDKSAAWQFANKCVDVTPQLAYDLIQVLQAEKIDYIVAPYEADAQMAYLSRCGLVDAVITEDSDLILFGCQRILFKMAADGTAEELVISDLASVTDEWDLSEFTLSLFRQMCILSGCDYLPSIPKMGLKTAHRWLSANGTIDKALKAIKASGQYVVPPSYESDFQLAEWTFLYQRVYDPMSKSLVYLVDPSADVLAKRQDWDFLGPLIEPSIAEGIANGQLCPTSHMPFGSSASLSSKTRPAKLPSISQRPAASPDQMTLPFVKLDSSKPASPLSKRRAEPGSDPRSTRRFSISRSFKDLPACIEPEPEPGFSRSLGETEYSPYFAAPFLDGKPRAAAAAVVPVPTMAESIDPITLVKENIPLTESLNQETGPIESFASAGMATRGEKGRLLADYRYAGQTFKKFKS